METVTKPKGRMGRPPLPPNERRTEQLHFYATKAEKELLESKARAAGMNLSRWLTLHFFRPDRSGEEAQGPGAGNES